MLKRCLGPVLLLAISCGCPSTQPGTETPGPLAKKANVFDYDMQQRFVLDGQALCKLNRPTAEIPIVTYNMPDNAYMTGIHLGTLAMRYAVTGDADTRREAGDSIKALDLLCTVSGIKGLLARSAIPFDTPFNDDGEWHFTLDRKYLWRGDVSTDQMVGVMYGFSLAYDLVADDAQKAVIARDVADLVDYILAGGLRIIDVDGQPTRWGHYEPDYVFNQEPMNALLFLQHLKIALQVTSDVKYRTLYEYYALTLGYLDVSVHARSMADPTIPDNVNHSDDVLLYLAYYPLLRQELLNPFRAKYLESLSRAWNGADGFPGVKPEMNPLFGFAVAQFLGDNSGVANGVQTLKWFPLGMKWTPATIAGYESLFSFTDDPTITSPAPAFGQAVPIDRRPNDWSAWVQDPYIAGPRTTDPAQEYNGHDYLAAYWLGRFGSFIASSE